MFTYPWARRGDVNAFFGLMLDNVAVLIILFTGVVGPGRFSAEFVLTRMIPGTALGVLLGDLIYTWMAFRLARRTGRGDVTAMPLGLDTPSTFGVAYLILGPAVDAAIKSGRFASDEQAMKFAWHVGLASLALCGVFKLICAPFGNAVRRLIPRAGLLGSLAAIALALIAFLPMLLHGIGQVPLVGMVSLVLVLITLVAHRELPFRFPGALAAVLVGVAIFWLGRLADVVPAHKAAEGAGFHFQPLAMVSFYGEGWAWWSEVFAAALNRVPIVLPFALATIVGGIDCTESAAAAGDEYDTRAVLATEAVATIFAAALGGVIQNTPYIGHPAYKKMGGRAAYTLATGLFVGLVGYFGGFTLLFAVLPEAAMFPILVFVGIEITAQSFHATPTKHYPALALATLPALAVLSLVVIKNVGVYEPPDGPDLDRRLAIFQTLRCLSNGFLISGLLWAAGLAMILDGRLRIAAAYFGVAGLLTLIGVIHSPLADEKILWPWLVRGQVDAKFLAAFAYQTPYHWAGAYGLVALMLLGLSLTGDRGNDVQTE